jgi:hypothetical protein
VKILDDINGSIQKYMFMLLTTNLLVALLTWIGISLDRPRERRRLGRRRRLPAHRSLPRACGDAAATGMAAFMAIRIDFDGAAGRGSLAGHRHVVGTFVTTWMIGRIANMNAAAIFISLLFWGWLWGVWGMLLSIPIIVIVKVVSQHVEQLSPLAELLGD